MPHRAEPSQVHGVYWVAQRATFAMAEHTKGMTSPSLSFLREEVHTLITQAAWHLGPLSDSVREWHIDLEIPSFGWTLLRELEGVL